MFLSVCRPQTPVVIKSKQLPKLSIENKDLLSLVDDIARFFDSVEQKNDSLFITIHTYQRPGHDFYTLLMSSNQYRITIFDGCEDPIGYFYHDNYLFVVYNKDSEQFFSATGVQKSFYYNPKIKDKQQIIDDSQSYWWYYYKDGNFVLFGECIPPQYDNQNNEE